MKKLLFILAILSIHAAQAQFTESKQTYPGLNSIVKKYTILNYIPQDEGKSNLDISIPYLNQLINLSVNQVASNPDVITSSGDTIHQQIRNYQNNISSFTFSKDEAMGLILTDTGNFVIGKLLTGIQNEYIIYNDRDLLVQNDFECQQRILPESETHREQMQQSTQAATKCINWYWETDYDLYLNKGNSTNVNFYMQGIWNQVQQLYARDTIIINLKTLFIWDHQDPYNGPTTADYLNQFGAYRTTFNGDEAHLIGLNGSGGIAWVNVLCASARSVRMAYSGISANYSIIPTYSWTVDCVSHEQGHVCGSPHTHDCAWNGNNTAIDGCYTPSGCANPGLPPGGGTIMSYCHLTTVGKNFLLGFGPQPKGLITSLINGASCLSSPCGCVNPVIPSTITGPPTVHKGQSNVLFSVTNTAGLSYNWILPPSAIGSSVTSSITVNFLINFAGGNICVSTYNLCGSSNSTCKVVDVDSSGEVMNIDEAFSHGSNDKDRTHIYNLLGQEILRPDDFWQHGIYILKKGNMARRISK